MGVITYEREVNTTIPPAKMFKALAIDGDGGPGTIKQINFDEGQLQ